MASGPGAGIVKCTKKELVYSDPETPRYVLVQVDKNGQEEEISDPEKFLISSSYPYPSSVPADKKGFFAIGIKTNPPPSYELIRFSSK
jgi:hypothetical protein